MAFVIINWNNMLVQQTYSNCYNIHQLDHGFASSEQSCTQMLFDLTKNGQFYPLLSQDIISNIQLNHSFYELSLEETI